MFLNLLQLPSGFFAPRSQVVSSLFDQVWSKTIFNIYRYASFIGIPDLVVWQIEINVIIMSVHKFESG